MKNDKNTYHNVVVSIVAIIVLAIAYAGYSLWTDLAFDSVNNALALREQGQNKIANTGEDGVYKRTSENLPWLPMYQKMIELNQDIEIHDGNILISSLVSPDKTKVVYTQISKCFEFIHETGWGIQDTPDHSDPCDTTFTYSVHVKDLGSDKTKEIYTTGSDVKGSKFPVSNIIIPFVSAAGAPTFGEFPVGWSKDSTWIIVKKGMLLGAAVGGGADDYQIGRFNIDTSTYEPLSKGSTIFSADFRYMIYTKNDPTKPRGCLYSSPSNPNNLILAIRDLSDNSEEILYRSQTDSIDIITQRAEESIVLLHLVPSKITQTNCIGSDEDRINSWDKRHFVKEIEIPRDIQLVDWENEFETLRRWGNAHNPR